MGPVLLQTLRVLGNACIDHDPTRLLLLQDDLLGRLLPLFAHPDLMVSTIAQIVFINLLTGYPAAQRAAVEAGAVTTLLEVIEREGDGGDCGSALRGLGLVLQTQEKEEEGGGQLITQLDKIVQVLLRHVCRDIDLYERTLTLDNLISALAHEPGKAAIDTREGLTSLLRALEDAATVSADAREVNFFPNADEELLGEQSDADDEEIDNEYDEDEGEWKRARKELDRVLGDVEFARDSVDDEILLTWLQGSSEELWITACVLLGNVATLEDVCVEFVHNAFHRHLVRIMGTAKEKEAVHFAAGFLRNLAIPPKNKDVIASVEGCWDVLRGLWEGEDVRLRIDGVGVCRMLVNMNLSNSSYLMLGPGLFDPLMNVIPTTEEKNGVRDDPHLEIERARTIAAVLRTLHFAHNPALLMPMTKHDRTASALACLVTQSTWPALQAEGFLALALLGKTNQQGRAQVREVLKSKVVGEVVHEVLGLSSEKGVRENARVCVVECTAEGEAEGDGRLKVLREMALGEHR
ncbi:ARM repeat-containing protein [Saitoella complicata NRRL Y-17804]|uniref:ARM repeat-containing protein n=1 Tax=Saitoella complicata (strain BCRC 22490 / CBS 7301 / JCM 7358 / NBRC 10748 / NRRL Y-17804) TaxID=698492 RepID=UPI000866D812|nr:ARM repeat-containing protein [Saitoella complicata NRRL Y-17804]ODQ49813.1 ARM repeat-containing protein [Saitoella complicata NRRL Y-17804]